MDEAAEEGPRLRGGPLSGGVGGGAWGVAGRFMEFVVTVIGMELYIEARFW